MKPDAWPFVPPAHRKKIGESPFRVRGSMYAGYVEQVKQQIPGGLSTICAEIGKKDVDVFLRDTIFLATSSYDMEPIMHMSRALAKVSHTPIDKFLRDGSRAAAAQDIAGKYRAQLRSTSTEEMATRLPRIFGRYFDPCRVETVNVQAQATEMRYSGLPASALGLYIWSSEGFVAGALEAVGARDVRFAWNSPVPDGELEGVPLQSITSRVSWTNPAM